MHAIRIEKHGGPEVMTWTELPDPVPGPGEALVRLVAAGVNYMDTGIRQQGATGWAAPLVLGAEGEGRVIALGEGVDGLAIGDRVAWYDHPGSYAELIAIPAGSLVKIPEGIADETAAAVMLQGITAHHMVTETYRVKPGDTAVVHAAAGGVGLLLTQMAKARGATVIGLVSRDEKVATARDAGADHVLVWSGGGFEDRIRELTGGEGAHVVYDGGGTPTFAARPALARSARLLRSDDGRTVHQAERPAPQHLPVVPGAARSRAHTRGPGPAHRRDLRHDPRQEAHTTRRRPLPLEGSGAGSQGHRITHDHRKAAAHSWPLSQRPCPRRRRRHVTRVQALPSR
jgi:NADPH:quinone reductase-like Zn-dependent oxidoreductase